VIFYMRPPWRGASGTPNEAATWENNVAATPGARENSPLRGKVHPRRGGDFSRQPTSTASELASRVILGTDPSVIPSEARNLALIVASTCAQAQSKTARFARNDMEPRAPTE
jgi:hypothetical protein